MPAWDDQPIHVDAPLSRPDHPEPIEASRHRGDPSGATSRDHARPRDVPRFIVFPNRATQLRRYVVSSTGQTPTSQESTSAPSASDAVATAAPPCPRFGKTKAAASEFARHGASLESWSWTPNQTFQDEPRRWSVLLRFRKPEIHGLGALLVVLLAGMVIGGGLIGIGAANQIGALADVFSFDTPPVPPLGLVPDAVGDPETAAGVAEPWPLVLSATHYSTDIARIPPRRASPPRQPVVVPPMPARHPPPPESSLNGSVRLVAPPTAGDGSLAPSTNTTISAPGGVAEEDKPVLQHAVSNARVRSIASRRVSAAATSHSQPSSTRNHKIQLGLFLDKRNATNQWRVLSGVIDYMLDLDQIVVKSKKYHRLYFERLGTLDEAISSCDQLKESGIDCYVVH